MKYKIRTVNSRRKFPEVVFEDEKYSLIGEMLLAERAFLTQLLDALDSASKDPDAGNAAFAGNAFSLFIAGDHTKITNDITGTETEAPTADLKKLVRTYQRHYDKLHR